MIVVQHEARPDESFDHKTRATESFRAMFRRNMSGSDRRYKPYRNSPGGPDPYHH